MDELEKKIKYYYRNDFPIREICKKTGKTVGVVNYRIKKMKEQGILKKWWEEGEDH